MAKETEKSQKKTIRQKKGPWGIQFGFSWRPHMVVPFRLCRTCARMCALEPVWYGCIGTLVVPLRGSGLFWAPSKIGKDTYPQAAHSPHARSFSGKFFATPLSSTYRLTWVWFVDAPPGSRGTLSTSCICAIARNVSSETDAADVPACSRSDDAWRAAASADSAGPVAM